MSFPIKAVIFDWAGTMVDFGCMAPVEALIEAFAAHGVAITAADARRDLGGVGAGCEPQVDALEPAELAEPPLGGGDHRHPFGAGRPRRRSCAGADAGGPAPPCALTGGPAPWRCAG